MKRYFAVIAIAALLLSAAMAQAANLKEGFVLKSVSEVGKVVELTDGSVWSVDNPADWPVAYNWLPGQKIGIRDGNELVNLHRGEWVDATMTTQPGRPTPQGEAAGPAAPGARAQAPAPPNPELMRKLDLILKRLDTMDAKIQVMDWRVRQLEREVPGGPRPNVKP